MADLHGYSFEKVLSFLESIGFSQQDQLYILVDVVDRGEDGIRILQWIMKQKNVQMLLGNHEDMMCKCAFLFEGDTALALENMKGANRRSFDHWVENGGLPTLQAMTALREKETEKIFEFLRSLPLYLQVQVQERTFILVHGGLGNFDPQKPLEDYTLQELVWTRPTKIQRYYTDKMTVLGHTPTLYYSDQLKGRAFATDTWIDIDVGAAIGIAPMILRLDDLQEFYMDEE